MSTHYIIQTVENYTIVEFRTQSLMDPVVLEEIAGELYKLVDEQDRRLLCLDFERVQYLSSQAIGIVMALRKKLAALPHTSFVLCGVGAKLMELIKITKLDRVLKIKPTTREAVKVLPN